MTLIFNNSEFWIESLDFPELDIVPGGNYGATVSLEKPGKCMGLMSSLRQLEGNTDFDDVVVKKSPSELITFGEDLLEARATMLNHGTLTRYIRPVVILFMHR